MLVPDIDGVRNCPDGLDERYCAFEDSITSDAWITLLVITVVVLIISVIFLWVYKKWLR